MLAKMRNRFVAWITALTLLVASAVAPIPVAVAGYARSTRETVVAMAANLAELAPVTPMLARPQRGISVIDMVVAMLVIIAVLPTVITDWFNVQTTNWGAAGTIWDLAPLLAIVGLLIWFRQRKGGVSGGI